MGWEVVLAPFYILFTLSTILGNSWVISLLLRQLAQDFFPKEGRKMSVVVEWRRGGRKKLKPGTLHLLLLSFTDFLSASSIILLFFESFSTEQALGNIHVCQLFFVSLGLHRFLSPALLTSLAFDRFWSICRPSDDKLRRFRAIMAILILCVIYASCLTTPSLSYATFLSHSEQENNFSVRQTAENSTQQGCVVLYPSPTLGRVVFYARFVGAYLLPCIVMMASYGISIRKLWRHTSRFESHIPMKRVAWTCTGLVIFHILCWSPYWLGSFYAQHVKNFDSESHLWSQDPEGAALFIRLALTISFLQPSLDWLLYVYLNKQLRAAPDRLGGLPTRILNKIYKDLSQDSTEKERINLLKRLNPNQQRAMASRRSFLVLSEAARGAEAWASSIIHIDTHLEEPLNQRRHSNLNSLEVPVERNGFLNNNSDNFGQRTLLSPERKLGTTTVRLRAGGPYLTREPSRSVPFLFGRLNSLDHDVVNTP